MNDTVPRAGILFDLDGTLWDTSGEIVPIWNTVLTRRGLNPITTSDMAGYMGKTPDAIASLMLPDLPHDTAMAVLQECFAEEQVYLSRHGGVLYRDVEATLTELQQQFGLYIVSNCDSGYLDAFFTAHGLRHYFDDFATHGDTGLSKADNIRLMMERHHLTQAVYVGDTELDKISAESAGVPFIFAAYGFGHIEDAAYQIEQFSDLLNVVQQFIIHTINERD